MTAGSYFVYATLGLLILLAVGTMFAPIRLGLKALVHVSFGFVGLIICNVFGAFIGVTVGINLTNTLLITLLGPSGCVLLLLLGWSLT